MSSLPVHMEAVWASAHLSAMAVAMLVVLAIGQVAGAVALVAVEHIRCRSQPEVVIESSEVRVLVRRGANPRRAAAAARDEARASAGPVGEVGSGGAEPRHRS